MRYDLMVQGLKDNELLSKMKDLVKNERKTQIHILACIAEIEKRKIHAIKGYSSMVAFVVEQYGYSEASALKRIQVARQAVRFPEIFYLLEDGKISLTSVMKLCPHLKVSNHERLLHQAQGRSVRQVEQMVASEFPRPEPPDSIKPISEDRVWIGFAGDKECAQMIEEARDFLRHKYPQGKMKDIMKEGLRSLLNEKKKAKTVATRTVGKSKNPHSRHVPKAVAVAVWQRDESRCSYVSPEGKRCEARGFLELDHKIPFSMGGRSDDVNNIRLLCRTHNALMADNVFGGQYIEKKILEKHKGYEGELYMNRFRVDLWQAGSLKLLKNPKPIK